MEERRPLPYVAMVRIHLTSWGGPEPDIAWGTGLLVDPYHVLTCFHVVHPAVGGAGVSRANHSEPLPRFDARRGERRIEVDFGAEIGAFPDVEIVAEDEHFDLALLRLDAPVIGPRAPIEPRPLPSGARQVWVGGVQCVPEPRFTFDSRSLDPAHVSGTEGQTLSGAHQFAVEEGYSGGPIFAEIDGLPAFVGIADIGGLGISTGGYVAADRVRNFLAGHGVAISAQRRDDEVARRCRIEGYAPDLSSPRPGLLPDHQAILRADDRRVVYHALHPITAAVASQRPGAHRLAAHLTDADAVGRLLARLCAETRLPLRLPTGAEFRNLCTVAAPPSRILGRPTTIDDYLGSDGLMCAPPDTSAEWVEEDGRRFLLLHRDERVMRIDDPTTLAHEFHHVRAVVRTVFQPGRAAP